MDTIQNQHNPKWETFNVIQRAHVPLSKKWPPI